MKLSISIYNIVEDVLLLKLVCITLVGHQLIVFTRHLIKIIWLNLLWLDIFPDSIDSRVICATVDCDSLLIDAFNRDKSPIACSPLEDQTIQCCLIKDQLENVTPMLLRLFHHYLILLKIIQFSFMQTKFLQNSCVLKYHNLLPNIVLLSNERRLRYKFDIFLYI